jgi:hypothetical protein
MIDEPFTPIPIGRVRSDGWSTVVQRRFIEALAETGSVSDAAAVVGRHVSSAYRLRARPEAAAFRAAWAAASAMAYQRLHDLALDRIAKGTEEPVLDKDGHCVFRKTVHDNRLLMFMLDHLRPAYEAQSASGICGGAGRLAQALGELDAEPPTLTRLVGPAADVAFTREEAEVLAAEGVAVNRIELDDGRVVAAFAEECDQVST